VAEKQIDPIAQIQLQLSDYQQRLTRELSKLKDNEQKLKEKLRQVKAIRRASASNTENEKPKLPAPKKTEVIQAVTSVLQAGPLTEEELKERVAGKLKADHTLVRFPLRMKEILRAEFLEVDSKGLVRLVANSTTNPLKSEL